MRYAIAILTPNYELYACHEVADSEDAAVLKALKSLDLYEGQPVDNLEDYLNEIEVEVAALYIDNNTDGCVLATYDANSDLVVSYYRNQTTYEAILHMLGGLAPIKQVKNLSYLIGFIEDLDVLVDCKDVKCYD